MKNSKYIGDFPLFILPVSEDDFVVVDNVRENCFEDRIFKFHPSEDSPVYTLGKEIIEFDYGFGVLIDCDRSKPYSSLVENLKNIASVSMADLVTLEGTYQNSITFSPLRLDDKIVSYIVYPRMFRKSTRDDIF